MADQYLTKVCAFQKPEFFATWEKCFGPVWTLRQILVPWASPGCQPWCYGGFITREQQCCPEQCKLTHSQAAKGRNYRARKWCCLHSGNVHVAEEEGHLSQGNLVLGALSGSALLWRVSVRGAARGRLPFQDTKMNPHLRHDKIHINMFPWASNSELLEGKKLIKSPSTKAQNKLEAWHLLNPQMEIVKKKKKK